jgi:hypothetical protein
MTRKDREKFFETVRQSAERFCPASSSMSTAEVREILGSAGCDTERLRQRLHESAKKLQIEQRLKNKKAPQYLQDVVDLTSAPEQGAHNPKIAADKAAKWIDGFMLSVPPTYRQVEVLRAYRKSGTLTAKDSRLLDELEQKLKEDVQKGKP